MSDTEETESESNVGPHIELEDLLQEQAVVQLVKEGSHFEQEDRQHEREVPDFVRRVVSGVGVARGLCRGRLCL